ncbi:lipid droplet-regulating VLDL assembly factor AUP1-like [Bacillus rossius redtenbacheri]|uniref:lipid droplet-regulating VLDL assembly factor AUP1-like n=1 Tax=Bacillus rossius redtenbacheri TaxID=93214 RepID=UPI002FDEB7F9
MATVTLKSLFNENRFPRGLSLIIFLLYFPFGVLLACVRLLVLVQACLLASALSEVPVLKSYILLCVCQVLGIVVQEEDVSHKNTQARILVSNHVTRYDQLPLHVATGCVTPHAWELPSCLDWALGVKDLSLRHGREALVSAVRGHLSKDPRPVLFHPEGATTSGRRGLLRFSTWPFGIVGSVQPVALTAHRPVFASLAPSVVGASHLADLLWFLCAPYTVFTIRYLPLMQRAGDETEAQSSSRVAEAVAQRLKVVCTNYTSADKAEFEKRLQLDRSTTAGRAAPRTDPVLQGMADRVAEVLPDVPLDVILRDVGRTQSVDATIANILDGVVPYTPLRTPRSTPAPAASAAPVPEGAGASSSFPRSAQDRMQSFQFRKARLIETARRKYIEKHNLTMADVADFAC